MEEHEAGSAGKRNEQERDLDAREARLDAREAQQMNRQSQIGNVLAKGAQRDTVAAARDWAASQRDMAANLDAWMSGREGHNHAELRRAALNDRLRSKADRASSAIDRSILITSAEDTPPQASI